MVTEINTQPLAVGTPAPDFSNIAATGNRTINLKEFQGKFVIMVFYPKDQTPGCTRQLCALRDDFSQFEAANTVIWGVNPDSLESHERFAAKESYTFPILVDQGSEIAKAYHALKEGGGIQRTVYVIGPDGTILFGEQGMPEDSTLLNVIKQHSK